MALRRWSSVRNLAALVRSVDAASFARGCGTASQKGVVSRVTDETAIGWRHWTAASAAALGFIFFLQSTEGSAQCHINDAEMDNDVTKTSQDVLRRWLESVGADIDAIGIRDSVDVCLPLAEVGACMCQMFYLK